MALFFNALLIGTLRKTIYANLLDAIGSGGV